MTTRQHLLGCGLLAAVLALTGCTGDKGSGTQTPSSSGSGTTSGAAPQAGTAELLTSLREGTATANGQTPTVASKVKDPNDSSLELGVLSLTAGKTETVLQLAARTQKDNSVLGVYTGEDRVAWRDLHLVSLEDKTGKQRYYPYRYRNLPEGPNRGSLTGNETALKDAGTWRPLGPIILPPLPEGVTKVDVSISNTITSTGPLGVIKDVPVTRG